VRIRQRVFVVGRCVIGGIAWWSLGAEHWRVEDSQNYTRSLLGRVNIKEFGTVEYSFYSSNPYKGLVRSLAAA
jgi:hypothetical protein